MAVNIKPNFQSGRQFIWQYKTLEWPVCQAVEPCGATHEPCPHGAAACAE